MANARGIIFVVDASTIARNGAVVAEYVYYLYSRYKYHLIFFSRRHFHTILHAITELPPSAHVPPVLIQAHKADLVSGPASTDRQTVAAERVRTVLERELEKRRQTSIGGVGVEGLGDADAGGAITGGLESAGDGTFRFDKWEGGEITCVGGWVAIGRPDSDISEKVIDEKQGEVVGLNSLNTWLDGL